MTGKIPAFVYGEKRASPNGFDDNFGPGRTAIVSIDMHQGHLADTPDCPCTAQRAREIIQPIDTFHWEARAVNVPTIHVRAVLRKGGVDDVKGGHAACRRFSHCMSDRSRIPWNMQSKDRAGPSSSQRWRPMICWSKQKKRLTPFYPTDLDFLLRNMEARVVVLNGVMTDCCVLNAAFDASNHDYRVIVLEDLVRGTTEEMEAAAFKMVSLHLGLVMDGGDLLDVWRRHGT